MNLVRGLIVIVKLMYHPLIQFECSLLFVKICLKLSIICCNSVEKMSISYFPFTKDFKNGTYCSSTGAGYNEF